MSYIKQIETIKDGELKRMCVYSERDYEYMVSKGWAAVSASPLVAEVATNVAEIATQKRRGRPSKVSN